MYRFPTCLSFLDYADAIVYTYIIPSIVTLIPVIFNQLQNVWTKILTILIDFALTHVSPFFHMHILVHHGFILPMGNLLQFTKLNSSAIKGDAFPIKKHDFM